MLALKLVFIRRAISIDLNPLVELALGLQTHVEARSRQIWRLSEKGKQQLPDDLRSLLSDPEAIVLVADAQEHGLVGMATGRISRNDRYDMSAAGHIDRVYVKSGYRRQGIGKSLVAGLVERFLAAGVDDITLRYVLGNSEGEAFWQSLGFKPRIVVAGTRPSALAAILSPAERGSRTEVL